MFSYHYSGYYIISAHLGDDILETVILNFNPYTFNSHLETYHQIPEFAMKLRPTSTLLSSENVHFHTSPKLPWAIA